MTVSNNERAKVVPRAQLVQAWAIVTGVNPVWLAEGDGRHSY